MADNRTPRGGAPQEDAGVARRRRHDEMAAALAARRAKIRQGGGERRIRREHERGKLTARERVARLVDAEDAFFEFGMLAGEGLYPDEGDCPAGGVVAGIGRVSGRMCVIVANDATVKAGAWFPITTRKNLRAQELALENHLPIIYLVDSAGIYLPLQDQLFPDHDHFGRIFRNNAVLSSRGIPQIAAIMGSCVAGGAYLPIMSDETLIVEGTGSVFLAGPFLVRAAIGEVVDAESLGGASMHAAVSGVTDYKLPNDEACLETIRDLVSRLGAPASAGFQRAEPALPARDEEALLAAFPAVPDEPYDMRDVLGGLIDAGSWTEYKAEYGQTLLTGHARIDGWSVGIVASQRKVVRTGEGEMQIGGVIYSDSADKAARFVMTCNQKRIPLVFLQDVTGFMVGKRAERGGIIKDGAKLVNAVANSVVPKFTVLVGASYGAGNYALCGRAYDPTLMLAWPTARLAVMGGRQAAATLAQIQEAKITRRGKAISAEEHAALLASIEARYEESTTPYYAAARMWVDEIVLPSETRRWLSAGINLANHRPGLPPFRVGVLQT